MLLDLYTPDNGPYITQVTAKTVEEAVYRWAHAINEDDWHRVWTFGPKTKQDLIEEIMARCIWITPMDRLKNVWVVTFWWTKRHFDLYIIQS